MIESGRIAKYNIDRRLGTGGMAEVFKCHLVGIGGFDKTVVVKRILPHLAEDDDFVAMFLDEARIAANLNHPNIVQVYEIDQDDDGAPYIAMEFVRGPTFAQVIRSACKAGDLKISSMAKIVMGAAQGLDYAHHAKGANGEPLHIVHRDVSPHNIMVSLDGVTKVLDFGVARADGRLTHTRGGAVKGKARFMAPEMLTDPNGPLDGRADVFSLGVCLYVATVGAWPFNGTSDTAIMEAIARGEYRKPTAVVPAFPPGLEEIIVSALECDPNQRCPDCRTLAERLGAWLAETGGVSDQQLGESMQSLFPDFDGDTGAPLKTPTGLRLGSGSKPGLGSLQGLEGSPSRPGSRPSKRSAAHDAVARVSAGHSGPRTPPPAAGLQSAPPAASPAPGRVPRLAALTLVVLLALGAAFYFLRTPPLSPEEQARPFMEEARKAMANGKLALARDMIDRARAVPSLPARESIELVTLGDNIRAAEESARRRPLDDARDRPPGPLAVAPLAEVEPPRVEAPIEAPEGDVGRQLVKSADPSPVLPRAARRAPAAERTLLSVKSVPDGAQVIIDGRPAGTTPLEGVVLKPGPHTVGVVKDGFRRHDEDVTAEGGPLLLTVRLDRAPGLSPEAAPPHLKVTSTVPAQVTVDGVKRGPTPLDTRELGPGPHVVVLTAEGHLEATREISLVAGQTSNLAIELQRTPAPREAVASALGASLGECPEGAEWKGNAPPAGLSAWCAQPDGVRSGKFIRWYANGRRAEEGDYVNGKKNGPWVENFENGTERERLTWRRGVKTW